MVFVTKRNFDEGGGVFFLWCYLQSRLEDGVLTRANQEQIVYRTPTRTPTLSQRRRSPFRCFVLQLCLLLARRACQQLLVTHPKTTQGRRPQTPSSLRCFINIYLLVFFRSPFHDGSFTFWCSLAVCGFVCRSNVVHLLASQTVNL